MNSATISGQDTAAPEFHAHLKLGLHAVAQPLSILRARLYADLTARMNEAELRQLAHDASAQVERLCTLFNYMQELVLADIAMPQIAEVDLHALLAQAVEGVELWYKDAGIALQTHSNGTHSFVNADRSMTSQAISGVLMLMHGFSRPGDTVDVVVTRLDETVEVRFSNANTAMAAIPAESRLALAVLQTNLQRQHGSLSYTTNPCIVTMKLPGASLSS